MPTYPTSDPVDNILRSESYDEIVDLLNVPSFDTNGNIEFQSIVLADTGNVALTAGALGLNSNGDLIKHNGSEIGNLLPVANFSTRIAGVTSVTAAQNSTAGNYCLAYFTLLASEASVGTRYRVTGNASVASTVFTPLPLYSLGFSPFLSANATPGYVGIFQSTDPVYHHIPTVNMELALVNGGSGTFLLSGAKGSFGLTYLYNSDDTMYISFTPSLASEGSELGLLNQTQNIGLFYNPSGDQIVNGCIVTYDFTIEKL